jgi:mannose-6-phosphate isomerase-like protein (cupin superfamily)
MSPSEVVVVPPGEGLRTGNVEHLALSEDTPRFNALIVTIAPQRKGPPLHVHDDEDDAFYVLDGELTFLLPDGDLAAPAGTFVLVPPGIEHTFENRTDAPVRIFNIHAPAGFDLRLRNDDPPR